MFKPGTHLKALCKYINIIPAPLSKNPTYYSEDVRERAIGHALTGLTPNEALLSAGISVETIKNMALMYKEDKCIKKIMDELFIATRIHMNNINAIISKVRCDKQYFIDVGADYNGELKRAKDLETKIENLDKRFKEEIVSCIGEDITEDIVEINLVKPKPIINIAQAE